MPEECFNKMKIKTFGRQNIVIVGKQVNFLVKVMGNQVTFLYKNKNVSLNNQTNFHDFFQQF